LPIKARRGEAEPEKTKPPEVEGEAETEPVAAMGNGMFQECIAAALNMLRKKRNQTFSETEFIKNSAKKEGKGRDQKKMQSHLKIKEA